MILKSCGFRIAALILVFCLIPHSKARAEVAEQGVGLPGSLVVGRPLPKLPQRAEDWYDAKVPPGLRDADGRYGILFVWRQGSIACRNSLAWLSELASRRPELRMMSVHTPRHTWEHETERMGSVLAYDDARIPVLKDNKAVYWHAAGFSRYPTFVLFDPEGVVVAIHEGHLKKGSREGAIFEQAYEESLTQYLRDELLKKEKE